jgi:hypothetical protein
MVVRRCPEARTSSMAQGPRRGDPRRSISQAPVRIWLSVRINHAWVAQFGQSIAIVTRRSAVRARLQAPVRGRVIGSSPVLETGSCRFEPCPRSFLPGVAQRQSRPLLTVTMGVQIRPPGPSPLVRLCTTRRRTWEDHVYLHRSVSFATSGSRKSGQCRRRPLRQRQCCHIDGCHFHRPSPRSRR